MNIHDQYHIIVGTVRGALASTTCKAGHPAKYELGEGESVSEITALRWGRTENEIIVGDKNGQVKLYSIHHNKYTKTIDSLHGAGSIVGVAPLEKAIVAGRYDGHINIWTKKSIDNFNLNLNSESSLECAVLHETRNNIIGTGGFKNDFKLWDLETKQCIFKAKSLGHDNLNLPIPTSVRGISYFPLEEKLSSCATKEGYVLLYDERAQRRPVSKFIEPKASYSVIASAYKDRQCVVGTTKGYIQLIDLRLPTNCLKTFKSFTGAVTDIVCDPSKSVIVSACLDRFLRIHDMETKKLLYKEYLKQNLTKLILRPKVKDEPVENIEENQQNVNALDSRELIDEKAEEIDEEYEELFDNLGYSVG